MTASGSEAAEVGARESLAFLARALGPETRTVLEVGCGRGEVAAGLVARGLSVVALDVDGSSVEAARALLRPGGALAVDDYDWAHLDEVTARFGHGLLGAFAAAGLAPPDAWGAPERARRDPLGAWRDPLADEGLHTGEAMRTALSTRFEIGREERAPYLYRYLARHLVAARFPDSGGPARAAAHALATERALIEAGAIRPLGLRLVASTAGSKACRAPAGA